MDYGSPPPLPPPFIVVPNIMLYIKVIVHNIMLYIKVIVHNIMPYSMQFQHYLQVWVCLLYQAKLVV